LLEIFHYYFFQNALLAGSAIAIACAALGVFLVARKSVLIGDGLSHFALGAISFGLFFGFNPYFISIPAVILASIFIGLNKSKVIGSDSFIGIFSSFGLALGIMLSSKSLGQNASLYNYLFGSILSVTKIELYFSYLVLALTIFIIWRFFREFFAIAFQEEYARTLGINTQVFDAVFFALVGLVIILAVRVSGVMLSTALIILPATSGLKLSKNFSSSLVWSGALAVLGVALGLIFSLIYDLPAGATIVMVNLLVFLAISFIRK